MPAVLATDAIGADPGRQHYVRDAVERGHCWLAETEGDTLGYVVADRSFFGHPYIALVIVAPTFRRRGVASALMRHVETLFPGSKLFTSTNQSNTASQALMESLGYVRSGIVENLDEGDPELIYFKRVGSA